MDVYTGVGVFALGVGVGLVLPLMVYWQQCRGARHKAMMTGQWDYIPHGGPCPGPYDGQCSTEHEPPDVWLVRMWIEATEHKPAHWLEVDVGTQPARREARGG